VDSVNNHAYSAVRDAGLTAIAAITLPVTVPAVVNACLSNVAACTSVGASVGAGIFEEITGEETGLPPSDAVDAVGGAVGRAMVRCAKGTRGSK
jgi:hypothetical protein